MRECSKKRLAFVYLLIACLLLAGPLAVNASTNEVNWKSTFKKQVLQHPSVVAVKEKMNAAESIFRGSDKPIYNPSLSADVEREGDSNNYRIGITQTVDWQDKVSVREKYAGLEFQVAEAAFHLAVQTQTAETLRALVSWQVASQQAALAREQEAQLDIMLTWIDERQKSGDVGGIDAELTVLGLAQRLNTAASAEAALKNLKTIVDAVLPGSTTDQQLIPDLFWSRVSGMSAHVSNMNEQRSLETHPAVLIAKSDWEKSKSIAQQVRQDINPDPTIGINAGKTGDDNIFGFSFSLPLNTRNSYSAELKATRKVTLSMEAEYYSVRREQQRLIASSLSVLQVYQSRIHRWRQLMSGRGGRRKNLIDQQWRSGDLSTAEYLLVMQQISESLSAGFELEKQYKLALIDWLLQTGQLNAALTP